MVARIVIFSTSAILAIMLLLSYYGLNVGTFTVVIDNEQQTKAEIMLSDKEDLSKVSQRLTAVQALELECLGREDYEEYAINPDLVNELPIEITNQIEDLVAGSQNQDGFFCYTFYVINYGNTTFDYAMDLNISSAKNNADSAVRIMLVWDRDYNDKSSQIDDIQKIYAKAQGADRENPGGKDVCSDQVFLSSTKIFTESRTALRMGRMDRVSILMWIHGWDPEATDEVKEGKVRLSLRIRITDILAN